MAWCLCGNPDGSLSSAQGTYCTCNHVLTYCAFRFIPTIFMHQRFNVNLYNCTMHSLKLQLFRTSSVSHQGGTKKGSMPQPSLNVVQRLQDTVRARKAH